MSAQNLSQPPASLPFRTTVCGIEELGGHCDARVSHVLSILDPDFPVPQALGAFGEYRRLELRFDDVIDEQAGKQLPQAEHVRRILDFGWTLVAEGPQEAHLLVHCHAGVSRSTAAMALILAVAQSGSPAAEVFGQVLRIRPHAWPNLRILELGDALLSRQGEIVEAAGAVYRRQLVRRPELAQDFRQWGRGREVDAGLRAAHP